MVGIEIAIVDPPYGLALVRAEWKRQLPFGSIMWYHQNMAKSISGTTKKRGRPKTTGTGIQTGLRLLPDLVAALDAWTEEQPIPPTRPEAIRQILTDYLKRRGYMK